MITISPLTERRFILGKQGLWPGRRWKGKVGTTQAIRACEAVQLDPLNIFARSQDIVLFSRVLGYKPAYLYEVAYQDRQFFDYGGWLAMYPMPDLPYFRVHMHRRSHQKRIEKFVLSHEELFEQVRAELRRRGPLGNRDLDGKRIGAWNYRGRKDTSLALFDMWLSGELMIHHREGFERVYDFRENIAPKEYDYQASEKEAELFFARKAVSFHGLLREAGMRLSLDYDLQRKYERQEAGRLLKEWIEAGVFIQVQVIGKRDTFLCLAEDLPLLETLELGKIPRLWKPRETSTLEEVTFLSPLDIVSARGRAKKIFDFEYKWEVYTPAQKRRWGYYVLPVLYGDDLVARLDPKLDRTTMTLEIKGYWQEEDLASGAEAYVQALARGLIRFADFVQAANVKLDAVQPVRLRRELQKLLKAGR